MSRRPARHIALIIIAAAVAVPTGAPRGPQPGTEHTCGVCWSARDPDPVALATVGNSAAGNSTAAAPD